VDTLRVMVVDDTSLYRMLVTHALRQLDHVEVVGSAVNGEDALKKVPELKPDLITLDVEMPIMDGLTTLGHLQQRMPDIGVVMISSLTQHGAETTMQALELGAFDFVGKPDGKDLNANKEMLAAGIKRVLQAFMTRRSLRALMASRPAQIATPAKPSLKPTEIEAVAVGISTGGPNALGEMVPQLPADLGVPIFLVQHMPPSFTAALAATLDRKSAIHVVEGAHRQVAEANTIYIAPGGKHMKVRRQGAKVVLEMTEDPPEHHCRPAVDYLFRSVAEVYGPNALGVVMTGMGADGALGLSQMKKQGAQTMAQNEESCVVYGMPMEAAKTGDVDEVLPLDRIAAEIARLVKRTEK